MEINKIYSGNAFDVLKTLPDNTIDCCITSPPYWGLRDYGHENQLGCEKHFKEFVINLANIFDEVRRVLKDIGTCFVNLGDTYGTQSGNMGSGLIEPKYGHNKTRDFKQPDVKMHKSLCLVPERFAIEMVERGWALRNQIIWHKPNQMPQSATDRFTVDFEKIFFFVKSQKYYFEQQLEPYTEPLERLGGQMIRGDCKTKTDQFAMEDCKTKTDQFAMGERSGRDMRPNPEGRNMRTVWSINTEPTGEAHFATYPQRLVERMIKAGCPENGLVLDPFFGSGTTGLYARKANRNFLGIELNPDYVKIAENRLYKEIGMFL